MRGRWADVKGGGVVALSSFLGRVRTNNTLGAPRVCQLVSRVDSRTQHIAYRVGGSCRSRRRLHTFVSHLANGPISRAFGVFPPFCASFNGGVAVKHHIFVGTNYRFRSRNNIALNSNYLVKRGIIFTALSRNATPRSHKTVCPTPVQLNGGM